MILRGITALELNGLAPNQYCGKILCDFGAKVIRIDKTSPLAEHELLLANGKYSVSLDLKTPKGVEILKELSKKVDVLVEPYRPGVMENLGLGPNELLKGNKRLVYVRLSGFGQSGPYSNHGGHDVNFISLSGVLSLFGRPNEAPVPPCNIVGDFASGSLLGAFGTVLALFEREKSGLGQVVDVSMMKGSAYLASWIMATRSLLWAEPTGCNLLDGGSYVYKLYKTKDGKWMSVASIEPKFYRNILKGLGLTESECPQFCHDGLEIFKKRFLEKTQNEWIEIFKNLDACVTPVLSIEDTVRERPEDFMKNYEDGLPIPQPEPRFSRSLPFQSSLHPPPKQGEHTVSVLSSLGYTAEQIRQLASDQVIYFPKGAKL